MSILEAAVAYRVLTSRATLTGPDGLEGINTHEINQGALVLAAGAIYRLDRDSSAVADGVTVIAPVLGPGRWLFVAASGGATVSVANLTDLAVMGVASPDLVWVETLLCYWHRSSTSVLAPDGITVVAAVGGGNWERIVPTTAPDWLAQAAWTIDPLLGDDENAGGALAPLASFDELNRRLSVGAIMQTVDVTIVAGALVPHSIISVELLSMESRVNFNIRGIATVIATDEIATYVDRNHATGVATQITAVGIADWTPYVGRRVRVTSGASVGAIAWIAAANPAGAGVNVARMSRFATYVEATGVATAAVLAPGDTFVIETLPEIKSLHTESRLRRGYNNGGWFGLYGVAVEELVLLGDHFQTNYLVDGCEFSITGSSLSELLSLGSSGSGFFTRNANNVQLQVSGQSNINFHMSRGTVAVRPTGSFFLLSNITVSSTTTGITPGFSYYSAVVLVDAQIFDCSGAAIQQFGGSMITSRSGLSGTGNAIGLLVGGTGSTSRSANIMFGWPITADLPNLLGTTTPIRIEGSTDIDLTWAQVPFDSGAQRGVGTLVDGTATITARDANTRGVTVSHATLAGTAVGVLTVPTATATASQFVVNSVNAAGALVDDDSTFHWQIPPMARKVVIAQLDSAAAAG